MYKFPKTPRGLRSRIATYRKSMTKEKRTFGHISDGSGKRYLIFWIYLVLGDLKDAKTYMRWYEKIFEDDIGEPIQQLSWALLLHRMGDQDKAKYHLANLMLSNLYLIPAVLGTPIDPYPIRFGSSYADPEYAKDVPNEVLSAITDEDRAWMKRLYSSEEFHRYRQEFVRIHEELEKSRSVEIRSPLVNKAYSLLDGLKENCH